MSLLTRLLGRRKGDPYSEGIALFEQGRFADASELLRLASRKSGSGSSSLASFYLRQCLVNEGVRRIGESDPAGAEPWLAEASATWDHFPDLAYQHALSLALCERWVDARAEADRAIAMNPCYAEARLLLVCVYSGLEDIPGAAAELARIAAEKRCAANPIYRRFYTEAGSADVWRDVLEALRVDLSGGRDRRDLASIVELCQMGRWEEGIEKLRALCDEFPTYPDYRVKLAAALFQTGRTTQALAAVDSALDLNPRYRTAAHLKALILADQRRYADAREVILSHPALSEPTGGHPSEELFCSYLRGALALITGHTEEAERSLASWGDLLVSFPMAEMLRAAVDDLSGRSVAAEERLAALAKHWPGDGDYTFVLACIQLRQLKLEDMSQTISRWRPGADSDVKRREMLADCLRLAREDPLPPLPDADGPYPPAVRFATARSAALREDWATCLRLVRELADEGYESERLASLILRAYLATGEAADDRKPDVVSDSTVADRLRRLYGGEDSGAAQLLLQRYRELHPEDPRWTWLDPATWLRPVRRWIG